MTEARTVQAYEFRKWRASASKEEQSEAARKATRTRIARYGTAGPVYLKSENAYSRARGGTREDLGFYVRSAWEANYARYLRFLKEQGEIADWEYEPQTFVFHGVTRNPLSYTPDFKVTENDGTVVFHEVKGWMDSASRSRLKRMAKFYPDVKIIVIGEAEYKALGKWRGLIEGWE